MPAPRLCGLGGHGWYALSHAVCVRAKGDTMTRLIRAIQQIHNDERGHVEVGVPSLVAGIGAVILGIGAGGGAVLAIIGGVVLGVGIFITGLLRHRQIDYNVWERLDKLEK